GIDEAEVAALFRRGVERLVNDLDRIQAAGDLDDRRVIEVARERVRVDGGGGDDELEILAAREQALQVTEKKVDVERALVGFVEKEGVVLGERRVALRLGKQD